MAQKAILDNKALENINLSDYIKKTDEYTSGKITFTSIGPMLNWTESGEDIVLYLKNADSFGSRYFEGDPDKWTFSASGLSTNIDKADLCINGDGPNTITSFGNRILTTAKKGKQLLWENNNVNAGYSTGWIPLDLSIWPMVFLEFKNYKDSRYNGDTYTTVFYFIDGLKHSVDSRTTDSAYAFSRYFTITNKGIYIFSGYSCLNSTSSNMNVDSSVLIPYRIYGFNPGWSTHLLWENFRCNGTDNTTDTLTVGMALNRYDAIMVEHRVRYTAFGDFYNLEFADIDGLNHTMFTKSIDTNYRFVRFFTPSTNSVTFTTSYWISSGSIGNGSDVSVPYKIWGVIF